MEHGGEYAISVYNYKGSAYRTCHVIVEHAMRPPAMPDLLSSCDEYCSRSDLYLSDDTDTERSFRPTFIKPKFINHLKFAYLSNLNRFSRRKIEFFIDIEISAQFLNNLVCSSHLKFEKLFWIRQYLAANTPAKIHYSLAKEYLDI